MNTLTITLCASTRTGCLSAPIHSCADERLTLAGDLTLSAGTSVALITPRGDTLAHTILSEECAPGATIPLSTLTAQAAEYTRSCRAGDTREALLAIGDSEHPLALIPARIAQNPLYTIAPPTDLAPAYPTTETLKSLLAEMQAASNAAAQSATAARKSAEEAGESASSAASDRATAVYAATSAQAYAEVATAAQARASTYAAEASTSAANAASSAASARDAASSAISAANIAAGSASKAAASADSAAFALTASTNAANRAEVAAENAREADISAANSATAASQSATSAAQEAAQGVATLLQGKVDAAEAAKAGAEAAKTAAETAKAGADAAKAAAASSATAAANSASQANGFADEAKEYAEQAASSAEDPYLKNVVGISVKEFRFNTGDHAVDGCYAAAPRGAIMWNATGVHWAHDGTCEKLTFSASSFQKSGGFYLSWYDETALYIVYKGSDGGARKATIAFSNGIPSSLDVSSLGSVDITTILPARYVYVEGEYLVTSRGQVFNKGTLVLTSSFTAPLYQRLSPKLGGYFWAIVDKNSTVWGGAKIRIDASGAATIYINDGIAKSIGTPVMLYASSDGSYTNGSGCCMCANGGFYAKGLYAIDNSANVISDAVVAECIPAMYVPKLIYLGANNITYVSSSKRLPIVREVWRSKLAPLRFPNLDLIFASTTRTGDGRYYAFVCGVNNWPNTWIRELTEVR